MKKLFAVALFAFLLVGCDKSSPTDSTVASTSTSAVAFSETSMLKMTVQKVDDIVTLTSADTICHDSLRNVHMLDSLKIYLGLSDAQFDSVKAYGATLFTTLENIEQQVKDTLITKIQARELVKAARDQFIVSVQSILTADQLTLLDAWIAKFWNRPNPREGGPRGPGGAHGPHGPGGHVGPHGPGGPGGHNDGRP